jgi:predicted unusual protein kinase regulating ubiquinone biosynthesis (AarF/ABC1/UbiB family)
MPDAAPCQAARQIRWVPGFFSPALPILGHNGGLMADSPKVSTRPPTKTPSKVPSFARRSPTPRIRAPRAYWVTFVVVMSYLSLRFQMRFRSAAAIDRLLMRKHRKNAQRILRAITVLQGLYIKVGQLISILSNVLPEQFREGLETLQDRVPPHPFDEVEKRIREEFDGRSTGELFEAFEPEPLAAASIGQVHKATLKSGDLVAVKIQYPNIDKIVHDDLRTLRRIVGIIDRLLPGHGLPAVYREVRKIVLEELDYREEAANIERISGNFDDRTDVRFPKVIGELSTERVLTTSFIDGIKASDTEALAKAGIDRKNLAKLIISAYCQQIFNDRVYHADPHPGNLMVLPGPKLVFLDFGAVAEISPTMRKGMIEFVQGGLAADTDKIMHAMKIMGFVSKKADPEIFERIVSYMHNRFKEEIQLDSFNLRDIKMDPQKSLENLADLRRLDISLRDITDSFIVPKEWIMLERTILLLMGLCTELDPDLNPMSVIRPYLERFVFSEGMDLSSFLLTTAQSATTSLLTLPSEMRRFMRETRRSGLQTRNPDLDRHVRVLYIAGQQFVWTALTIACGAFALALHDRGYHEAEKWLLGGAGLSGLLLIASLLSGRVSLKRPRKDGR